MQSMSTKQEYEHIKCLLLPPKCPTPLMAPVAHPISQKPKPKYDVLVNRIAALQLHPNLESLLHIMNMDLASAHFLLRHMEGPEGYEAKMLHGLLHRIEGDMENAKLWYGNAVGSAIFTFVWPEDGCTGKGVEETVKQAMALESQDAKSQETNPGSEEAQAASNALVAGREFIDDIKKLRGIPKRRRDRTWEDEYKRLEKISEIEIERLFNFVEARFGIQRVEDASGIYQKKDKKHSEQASKQIIGGEGWRVF